MCSSSRCMGRLSKASLMQAKVLSEVEEIRASQGLGEDVSNVVAGPHPRNAELTVHDKFID